MSNKGNACCVGCFCSAAPSNNPGNADLCDLSHKASTLATCLKDLSHICVSLNRHLGSHKVQSQVWPGVSGSETSNLLEHALELRDQPGYRRCIGTGRWLSSAPLGTPRGTACRTAADQGPGPRWAGTWLLSSQSSLKGETHIQDSLLWLPQKHRENPLLLVTMGPWGGDSKRPWTETRYSGEVYPGDPTSGLWC